MRSTYRSISARSARHGVHQVRVKDNRRARRLEVQRLGVVAPRGGEIGVFALVNLPPLGRRDQAQHEVPGMPPDRLQGLVALLGERERAA